MTTVLESLDFDKLWTRTIGTKGERVVTNMLLRYGAREGSGYKAFANLTYMKETLRALKCSQQLWNHWVQNKIHDPPQALVLQLDDGMQGWLRVDTSMTLLARLTRTGSFDDDLTREVLFDWEDRAFKQQWQQFHSVLSDHIRASFDQLSVKEQFSLTWDAYIYAKGRMNIEPVTTYTNAIIPVHLLELHWLRYAKANFPYKRRGGSLPRL